MGCGSPRRRRSGYRAVWCRWLGGRAAVGWARATVAARPWGRALVAAWLSGPRWGGRFGGPGHGRAHPPGTRRALAQSVQDAAVQPGDCRRLAGPWIGGAVQVRARRAEA